MTIVDMDWKEKFLPDESAVRDRPSANKGVVEALPIAMLLAGGVKTDGPVSRACFTGILIGATVAGYTKKKKFLKVLWRNGRILAVFDNYSSAYHVQSPNNMQHKHAAIRCILPPVLTENMPGRSASYSKGDGKYTKMTLSWPFGLSPSKEEKTHNQASGP